MRKIFIILGLFLLPVFCFGQVGVWNFNGGVVIFQGGVSTFDTTMNDTITLNSIGDGIDIGDGIKIGDSAYLLNIELPKQYMREEETLNELIS